MPSSHSPSKNSQPGAATAGLNRQRNANNWYQNRSPPALPNIPRPSENQLRRLARMENTLPAPPAVCAQGPSTDAFRLARSKRERRNGGRRYYKIDREEDVDDITLNPRQPLLVPQPSVVMSRPTPHPAPVAEDREERVIETARPLTVLRRDSAKKNSFVRRTLSMIPRTLSTLSCIKKPTKSSADDDAQGMLLVNIVPSSEGRGEIDNVGAKEGEHTDERHSLEADGAVGDGPVANQTLTTGEILAQKDKSPRLDSIDHDSPNAASSFPQEEAKVRPRLTLSLESGEPHALSIYETRTDLEAQEFGTLSEAQSFYDSSAPPIPLPDRTLSHGVRIPFTMHPNCPLSIPTITSTSAPVRAFRLESVLSGSGKRRVEDTEPLTISHTQSHSSPTSTVPSDVKK